MCKILTCICKYILRCIFLCKQVPCGSALNTCSLYRSITFHMYLLLWSMTICCHAALKTDQWPPLEIRPHETNSFWPLKVDAHKIYFVSKIQRAKGGSTQHHFHFREQDYVDFWGYMVYIHQSIIHFHHSMGQITYISRVRVPEPHGSLMLNIHCNNTIVHHMDMLNLT